MQFSGKFGVFTPPLEGSRPPLGKILDPPLAEVSFNLQANNNATIVDTEGAETEEDGVNSENEEGECSTLSEQSGRKVSNEVAWDSDARKSIQNSQSKGLNPIVDGEPNEEPGTSGEVTSQDRLEQDYIDQRIETSLTKVQDYFERKFEDLSRVRDLEKQLEENQRQLRELKAKGSTNVFWGVEDETALSEVTVYRNAVEMKRGSSSSEDFDTSEEQESLMVNLNVSEKAMATADKTPAVDRATTPRQGVPSTPKKKDTAEERSERIIAEAEAARARIYNAIGANQLIPINLNVDRPMANFSYQMDEDYLFVASHVDEVIRQKIINGEYVDFIKLIRKDKMSEEEEQKMIMVNKGGMSYWVPMSHRNQTISSYSKWDQAFRVFLDIYTMNHANRTSELIQYGHIIQTASMTYAWENVYFYDREFRRHMERHPTCSWGVILQQAWTMYLKDRNTYTPGSKNMSGHAGKSGNVNCRLCFDYNEGNCTYGAKCKFEHKCSFCFKYGHGVWNCRRAANKNKQGSGGSNPGNLGVAGPVTREGKRD